MGIRLMGIVLVVLVLSMASPAQQPQATPFTPDRYHNHQEFNQIISALAAGNPGTAVLHRIGKSAGGNELIILEIGPEAGRKPRKLPAVLVVANLEGTVPIASEAALYLASQIVQRSAAKDLTWYILPSGNPDAAARYFQTPPRQDERNARRHNDDMDDQEDEDGPEDLNGDGIITQMRVKDPSGEWLPDEGDTRMMRRADPAKGEKGTYKLYSEGIDNDGDGQYNEDGPGGTDISSTFPHLFRPFTETGGLWPGSEEETFSLLQFTFAHPEIAMTFAFGSTNMCLQPPAGGRQGTADLNQIKIPERFASRFGADPNRTYTMKEVIDMVRPMAPPGFEITESVVASFLGLGAVVNPLEEDLKIYRELSERYKEFLKTNKLDGKRLEPPQPKDGSFELWSYYHLGVHTFTMDLWTLPEVKEEKKESTGITADKLEGMSSEAFIALGEEKISAFLKEVGAPQTIRATMLIEGVKAGKMTPKQMAGMLRQMPKPKETTGADPKMKALLALSDKELQGKGFVPWTAFKHPTLGEVEIGGPVPFVENTPPPAMIKSLLEGQAPWVFRLAEKLPRIKIQKTEIEGKGAGVFQLKAWISNVGALPFPTFMGRRNQQVPPAIITLAGSGYSILGGKRRTPVNVIDAGKAIELTWLIQSEKPSTIDIAAESANAWNDTVQIRLGGAR